MSLERAQQLNEERLQLVAQAKAIIDKAEAEKRDLTQEESADFDRIHAEADKKKEEADQLVAEHQANQERRERQQRAEEELRAARDPHGLNARGSAVGDLDGGDTANEGPTRQQHALAIQGWFRANADMPLELTDEHREACQAVGINPNARQLALDMSLDYQEVRAASQRRHAAYAQQSAVTGPDGGYITGDGSFVRGVEVAMLHFDTISEVAEVIVTESGNELPWPTVNDTSNEGRQIGESQPVTEKKLAFGKRVWSAFKFTSDEILVPSELYEDSPMNLMSIIQRMLGERLGRIRNRKFTLGDGDATPHGIVPSSVLGVTAAGANALTLDEMLDLEESVDESYLADASYMVHRSTKNTLRKQKSTDGFYLWQPSLQAGSPDTFNNYPIRTNTFFPQIGTGNRSVTFGDHSYYKIRLVRQIRIYRLTERHRENDQDAYLAFIRADGGLLDAGTNPVKHIVHP